MNKKIFIIDDHPVSLEGCKALLEDESDFIVCGTATNCSQAYRKIQIEKPDVIVSDLSIDGEINGIEMIKNLSSDKYPYKCPILVLSMHEELFFAERVLKAGAYGYIMKKESIDEIIKAVRIVLSKNIYVSYIVSNHILKKMIKGNDKISVPEKLSDTELEVLLYLGKGYRPQEICEIKKKSKKTIENTCKRLRTILNFNDINELIKFAIAWSRENY